MSEFEVARSTTIAADPARVHSLINDFHAWTTWSPWEDLDPELSRDYSGPDTGVGARYAWQGNRKAGQGSMEITESTPERIVLRLLFLKPWKADNRVDFTLTPVGDAGTQVTWRMTGSNSGLQAVFSKLFNMERLVGKDFDRGLARLKAAAEGGA
jgi:uncharacterized protein YndB with AHSA1/START domain